MLATFFVERLNAECVNCCIWHASGKSPKLGSPITHT